MLLHLPDDPILAALLTSQEALALSHGRALRFPAEVAPFAALQPGPADAAADLTPMLAPGDSVFLVASPPFPRAGARGLRSLGSVRCLQMIFPLDLPVPLSSRPVAIQPLSCADSADMLALIAVAYPGYFRSQTCRMGRYFGVRDESGTLIAMVGERLISTPWREISALCVHPFYAGRGLGSHLLAHLLSIHRNEGTRSWLWVTASNTSAQQLYLRFGFHLVRHTTLHRVGRAPANTR